MQETFSQSVRDEPPCRSFLSASQQQRGGVLEGSLQWSVSMLLRLAGAIRG